MVYLPFRLFLILKVFTVVLCGAKKVLIFVC